MVRSQLIATLAWRSNKFTVTLKRSNISVSELGHSLKLVLRGSRFIMRRRVIWYAAGQPACSVTLHMADCLQCHPAHVRLPAVSPCTWQPACSVTLHMADSLQCHPVHVSLSAVSPCTWQPVCSVTLRMSDCL